MSTSLVKISYLLETSEHYGFCVGNETEYKSEIRTEICIHPLHTSETFDWKTLIKYEHPPLLEEDWCSNSKESHRNGLGSHDYKITIIDVTRYNDTIDGKHFIQSRSNILLHLTGKVTQIKFTGFISEYRLSIDGIISSNSSTDGIFDIKNEDGIWNHIIKDGILDMDSIPATIKIIAMFDDVLEYYSYT